MSDSVKIATRASYGEFLVEHGKAHPELIVMCADLSPSNKTDAFAKMFPDRFVELGISEQDMYAEAAGIAHSGFTVAASSFSMFAVGRAYEIIRNSIAHTSANVKICATHAGLTCGEDGATHQTVEDIALMRVVPGMTVINPADDVSAKALLEQAFNYQGPVYVRLGKFSVPVVYDSNSKIKMGYANQLKDGKDLTIIATGIMVQEALEAANALEAQGINARLLDIHTIKPLDEQAIIKAAFETGAIITCEEHSVIGGLGSAVSEVLAQNCPTPIRMIGLNDCFGESGKPAELLEKYGLTSEAIIETAKRIKNI